MRLLIAVTAPVFAVLALAAPAFAADPPVSLVGRPAAAVALDAGRKPVEVLAVAGIEPSAVVADIMPGNGYYSELLGRVVGPGGKVIAIEAAGFVDPKGEAGWAALKARQPNVSYVAGDLATVALPKRLDIAFFHLTYHDLYWESAEAHFPRLDPAAFDARLFAAMNRGGTVIVIDHVGIAGIDPRAQADKTHRIDPARVRADFEKAGFRFVDTPAVLATEGDDPAKPVFDASVRGKTDRFYYRFVKP
ncbi:hypothetical protein IP88_07770 [alpha proteobacterium AAP81b]|nr:hypothetical protein IP88_07770 [alpha proteobacterium AAP81b]